MFGAAQAAARNYMKMKAGELPPVRTVTSQQFIDAAIAAGLTTKDAKFHATLSKNLGGSVQIGSERLLIEDPAPDVPKAAADDILERFDQTTPTFQRMITLQAFLDKEALLDVCQRLLAQVKNDYPRVSSGLKCVRDAERVIAGEIPNP